jgi:hypothetical protein
MKNKQDILKLHPMIGILTPLQWDEIHKAMDDYLNEYKAEQLTLTDVSSMFSAEQMEKAFDDGVEAEQQRCGEFDIENYC